MKIVTVVKPFHTDERGEMSYLIDGDVSFTNALLITCKKGSIRANHYHKKDTHYSFMLQGSMVYYYRNVKAKNKRLYRVLVHRGEVVKTPPNTLHAMKFLQDSIFIAFTTESRKQKEYEKDTMRVKLI